MALAALIAPPLAVFAPLGFAPLLALLAVILAAIGWRHGGDALRPLTGVIVLLALLSLWGALSAGWSTVPTHSLSESARVLLINAAGVIVFASAQLPSQRPQRLALALLLGLAAALLLLQVEAHSDAALGRFFKQAPADEPMSISRYDRGATVVLLSFWPAVSALALMRQRLAAAMLGAAVGITLLMLNSRTAVLAGALALAAACLAWRLPRVVAAVMIATVAAVAFVFPLLAPDGQAIERIHRLAPRLPESAIHRFAIWRFAADRIAERPLLGWGMDAARALPGGNEPVATLFPGIEINGAAQAMPLHPHDAALQWRLELGLPGALIELAALALALSRMAAWPISGFQRAIAFGFATSALAVAMLSFGAWQAWWLSALWLLTAILAALGRASASAATNE